MDASADAIDAFLEMEDRAFWRDVARAKALLSKLRVSELRVLMAHYAKGRPEDFNDVRKPDLIDEIAPEYVADQWG